MQTRSYADLVRDSKLLKKLLSVEKVEFKLAQCQEIVSKLYRFSSFHEAQKVLTDETPKSWAIEKPNYKVTYASLVSALKRFYSNDLSDVWYARTFFLLTHLKDGFFKDTELISTDKLVETLSFEYLVQNIENPVIKEYLEWLPGWGMEGSMESTREHHMYVAMVIQHIISPYITDFDNNTMVDYSQSSMNNLIYAKPGSGMSVLENTKRMIELFSQGCYLYAPPGEGKTTWASAMLNNWMFKNPGSKIVIFDIGPSWNYFIQYLKHKYKELKVFEFSVNEYNYLRCTSQDFINADIILLNFDALPNRALSNYHKKWLTQIENVLHLDEDHKKTLFILDEAHRIEGLELKRSNIFTSYVVISQTENSLPENDPCYNRKINVFLGAADPRMVWISNSSPADILLKYRLSERVNYLNSIDILTSKMKSLTLSSHPEFSNIRSLDFDTPEAELVTVLKIDRFIEANLI